MRARQLLAALCLLFVAGSLGAAEGGKWGGTAVLGMTSWGSLDDLEDAAGDGFDSVGWLLAGSLHRQVGRWGNADVLLGADLGVWLTESHVQGEVLEELDQRGMYLTPHLKLRFGERRGTYLTLQGGVGWYEVDFVELLCGPSPCLEIDEPFQDDTIGGYVGVGLGFGGWGYASFNAHLADFGRVTGFPEDNVLDGPIFMFSIGAALGR